MELSVALSRACPDDDLHNRKEHMSTEFTRHIIAQNAIHNMIKNETKTTIAYIIQIEDDYAWGGWHIHEAFESSLEANEAYEALKTEKKHRLIKQTTVTEVIG